MLARMLAKHYGFTCKVFITTDPKTGFINPGSSHISGLEALKTADLLVIFLRFQDFPDDQMQHIVDYLDRGGPVVGLRTATHAFQIKRPDAKFVKYTWNRKEADYVGGFGRQILGETWVSHYGANHKQSSRLVLQTANASPATQAILRGVKDVWVQSGGYTADPIAGSEIVALGEILNGMTPDSPPAADKKQLPVAWHRTYQGRFRQDGTRVHDDAWRVGGSVERGLPAAARQRELVGHGPGKGHHAEWRRQPRRPVSSDDLRVRRVRAGHEAVRHGGLGHADSQEEIKSDQTYEVRESTRGHAGDRGADI